MVLVKTTPFNDQKPGTSGLRKRVKHFQQPNYTENFIQAILLAVQPSPKDATLVVGGDGRYYGKEVVQIIIQLAAGNNVKKLIIGKDGILSTPAASHLIRKRKANGGILLTASHNPGGPENDFGIKYNVSNGGPAPEGVTDAIYATTTKIEHYYKEDLGFQIDLSTLGPQKYGELELEIVDSVSDWAELMQEIFDISAIKKFLTRRGDKFKLLFDAMHGVTGPYGKHIFIDLLGLPVNSVMNAVPLEDFGGGHPDPNLTYAHELVKRVEEEGIDFGAASDGDGDRNMIISKGWFVNPSDSVALIAAHAQEAIPYFRNGVLGLARSMPTSQALDRVAQKLGLECYEVPTGWKFFGNLMDAGRLSVCGEESFGTGSDHIREKDGLWAILAWLNILAVQDGKEPGISLKEIMMKHYRTYGRNYFTRYDYEEVDGVRAKEMMNQLKQSLVNLPGKKLNSFEVKIADDFSYVDPVDKSISSNQGLRLIFTDGSRAILRLSGTGSQGATVRVYVERYVAAGEEGLDGDVQKVLLPLVQGVLELAELEKFTGRKTPTVIT